ncbi:MAG: beta-ketoacyl synthase N-terminal-like domain-containing protein [Bacteriovoracaceae bacterium]
MIYNGLKKAFKYFGVEEKGYCTVGAVKTNIGHLEAAAGMAGIIKVVLALKNKKIPGLANFKKLNPYIELENSPFVIAEKTKEWLKKEGETKRRAGVSSFGFGGANAHIILEEYESDERREEVEGKEYIFVISGKREERVVEQARRIKKYVEEREEISLREMAYTLQVGREEMEERIGFVARSREEILEKLERYIEKREGVYRGNVKKENRTVGMILSGEAGEAYIQTVIKTKDLEKLVQLWVVGTEIEWGLLWQEEKPKIISLPVYPFEKKRYWIEPIQESTDKKVENLLSQSFPQKMIEANELKLIAQKDIIQIAADILKVAIVDIDPDEDLSSYGFDSILATRFINGLKDKFNLKLTPAIFFEYPSINLVLDYMLNEHLNSLQLAYGIEKETNLDNKKIENKDSSKSSELSVSGRIEKNREIAIIGMSGQFPGSPDIETYWENLKNNRCLITVAPEWRNLKNYQGGFVEDLDKFDAAFFNISPREAELIDPQQRLLLENTWKALEDANMSKSQIQGTKGGVFIGFSTADYQGLIIQESNSIASYVSTGNAHSILANRISYYYGLRGPSDSIDTACSSALVAVHKAVNSILSGESEFAIAGGVNALLAPEVFDSLSSAGMLSVDGRCKTFDENANGYVRGEGVGIVILKPLTKAIADGDRVYAVIKGTSENHGGHVTSLTVPNPNAQADLIIETIKKADIDPRTIEFIETHGTGTAIGDTIETNGLKKAFTHFEVTEKNFCYLGSVKTNIGHLESAAGVAGLIKTILALKNKIIPGLATFEKLNPYLELENSPFLLPMNSTNWTSKLRRAGVSSFGFGGSNAHVILESFENKDHYIEEVEQNYVFILSAKKVETLFEHVKNVANFIRQFKADKDYSLAQVAYILQVGREGLSERLGFVAKNSEELIEKLENYLNGNRLSIYCGTVKKEVKREVSTRELTQLVQLWIEGVQINWRSYWKDIPVLKISLPNYPFERKRHWITTTLKQKSANISDDKKHVQIGSKTGDILLLVKEAIAKVTSLPIEQLENHTVLTDIGIDSIMGQELVNVLSETVGFIEGKDLVTFPSIEGIANFLGNTKIEIQPTDYRKFEKIKSVAKANYRIFIFLPFGFGNKNMSKSWDYTLKEETEVWLVSLDNNSTWKNLINNIVNEISPYLDLPFVFYGHSMGSLVAFEVIQYIEKKMNKSPILFIPSASGTPEIFQRLKYTSPFLDITKDLDWTKTREVLERNNYLLPIKSGLAFLTENEVLNDIELIQNYSYNGYQVKAPIMAIFANNDILVKDPLVVSSWRNFTTGEFLFEEIDGNHLYFISPPKSFFQKLDNVLSERSNSKKIEPGVYELVSLKRGTDEVHTYPFGINPKGFIMYDKSGVMSSHIWNPLRNNQFKSDFLANSMSYFSYSALYDQSKEGVEHNVKSSSFPNIENDKLTRYVKIDNDLVVLKTAPYIRKEDKPNGYEPFGQVVWKKIEVERQLDSILLGAWDIKSIAINGINLNSKEIAGHLILMPTGHFSIILSVSKIPFFKYDNPVLATDEELLLVSRSRISLCGNFSITEKEILCDAVESFISIQKKSLIIEYKINGNFLTLQWSLVLENGDRYKVNSEWLKHEKLTVYPGDHQKIKSFDLENINIDSDDIFKE